MAVAVEDLVAAMVATVVDSAADVVVDAEASLEATEASKEDHHPVRVTGSVTGMAPVLCLSLICLVKSCCVLILTGDTFY